MLPVLQQVISIRNCSKVCLPCFTHLVVWLQIKKVNSNLGRKLKEYLSHSYKCNLIVWRNLVARNPTPTHHATDFGCSILHLILMGDVFMLYLLRWCYDSWFDKHVYILSAFISYYTNWQFLILPRWNMFENITEPPWPIHIQTQPLAL